MIARTPIPVLLGALALVGCGQDVVPTEATTRSDSAGVEIVLNRDSGPDARPGRLVFPPLLSLGSEEEGPELFGSIGWVGLDGAGHLWVSDSQAQELRVFELASGAHLMTLGGSGEGPGEFRRMRPLGFDGRGFAYVYDDALRRLTIYSPTGAIEDQLLILTGEESSPRPYHVRADGILVGQVPRSRIGSIADGQLLQDTVRIWTIDPAAEEPELVAAMEGPLFYYRNFQTVAVPFRNGARFGFLEDRVYFTHPSGEASFLVFGPHGLERRVSVERDRHRITSGDTDDYFEYLLGIGWTEENLRLYRTHLHEMTLPDFKPEWDYPLIDETGRVWLQRIPLEASTELIWDIFDASGAFLGPVAIPSELTLRQVTSRYAVGVLRDEFDRGSAVVLEFLLPGR